MIVPALVDYTTKASIYMCVASIILNIYRLHKQTKTTSLVLLSSSLVQYKSLASLLMTNNNRHVWVNVDNNYKNIDLRE